MDAVIAAAAAIERFVAERLAAKDVVRLTGLDQAKVRWLRLETDTNEVRAASVTEVFPEALHRVAEDRK
jgi:hypothetical protein